MTITNLLSSSGGNATLVESDNKETRIMIDAGTSYIGIERALSSFKETLDIDALFISHEHGDHISGAGVVGRKQGCPIYIPEKSFEKKSSLFKKCDMHFTDGGEVIEVGDLVIKGISTRHDSEASLAFIIGDKNSQKVFGYLTDTGAISKLLKLEFGVCDALFIESDYDTKTLIAYEEYDDILKERIMSPFGHLSNQQVIEYLDIQADFSKLQWVLIGHLSQKTNSPELLRKQLEEALPKEKLDKIYIADNKPIRLTI